MRPMLIAMLAFIAGILVFGAPSHAAPGPVLAATAGNVAGGMVQKVDYWHRYYRSTDMRQALLRLFRLFRLFLFPRPPLPSWSPRCLVPVRPASCGQYHYWNGVQCVDARYNNPYVGPR